MHAVGAGREEGERVARRRVPSAPSRVERPRHAGLLRADVQGLLLHHLREDGGWSAAAPLLAAAAGGLRAVLRVSAFVSVPPRRGGELRGRGELSVPHLEGGRAVLRLSAVGGRGGVEDGVPDGALPAGEAADDSERPPVGERGDSAHGEHGSVVQSV